MVKITTERLILRRLKDSDDKDIVKNVNNLNVSKWLLVVPCPYKLKDAKEWIKKNKEYWTKKLVTDYVFGIELKEEEKIIGTIGLHHVDRYQGNAEVGYWLGERYWKKGYGSEALKALINFAFKRLKLRRLEVGVFSQNLSSGKLLEKFGFVKEGIRKESRRSKADGKIHNEIMYGLLKKDYCK